MLGGNCGMSEQLDLYPAGLTRAQFARLSTARKRHLHGQTVDLRNSGDTAGPRDEVMGEGAWVFTAEA